MTCIAFVGIGTRPSANPSRPAASQSRKQPCASEIAKKAYWSSSYFSGTFADLESSRLRIYGWRRCHHDMHRGETDDE